MIEINSNSASSRPNSSTSSSSSALDSRVIKRRRNYLILWLLLNAGVWIPTILYLRFVPPAYTSQWTITVNAFKSSANVSLPGIGEATSSNDSAFSSHLVDPRENYRFLANSDEVIEDAARQMQMSAKEFGQPRSKIFDNSTLMQFEIAGRSPKLSRQKAFALQTALERKLDQLRIEEIDQQNHRVGASLTSTRQKLQEAQDRLYAYKARSPLASVEQLGILASNLEDLRKKRAEAVAQLQQLDSKSRQLSEDLGLSSQEASDSLKLRSDRLFQDYLALYSKASVDIVSVNSRLTDSSPPMRAKQLEKQMALDALMKQSQKLLKRPVSLEILQYLTSSSSSSGRSSANASTERASLYQNLVSLESEKSGIQSLAQGLNQQIEQFEARLSLLSQEEAKLDKLQRDSKIAEVVFSSNATKIELAKLSIPSMYPLMSILSKPNLPESPSAPKLKFALLGAFIGSLLISAGILTLWGRDKHLHKIKKITVKQCASEDDSNSVLSHE